MIENGIGQPTERASPNSKGGVAGKGLSLRLAHLNFLGRGLAQAAHDLKNHLATINEAGGLMEDLLKLEHRKRSSWRGRLFQRRQSPRLNMAPFLSDLKTIEKEIVQGVSLIQNLSRFAHRLEETRSVFDGDEALAEIRDVLLEPAREKGVDLEIRLSGRTPIIETNPSGFQMAVVWNVEEIMAGLNHGGRFVLQTAVREGLFQICLSSPCPGFSPPYGSKVLYDEGFYRDRVEALGGQIWNRSSYGKGGVTLAFPLAIGKA